MQRQLWGRGGGGLLKNPTKKASKTNAQERKRRGGGGGGGGGGGLLTNAYTEGSRHKTIVHERNKQTMEHTTH